MWICQILSGSFPNEMDMAIYKWEYMLDDWPWPSAQSCIALGTTPLYPAAKDALRTVILKYINGTYITEL